MATKLYASGKAGAGGGGGGAVNNASGMARTSGGRTGRDVGASASGALDDDSHHGVGISPAMSGLDSKVLASSEAGSCTALVKRVRSSGVSPAHIRSTEALPTKVFGQNQPAIHRKTETHQDRCPQAGVRDHHHQPPHHRRCLCLSQTDRPGCPLRTASADPSSPCAPWWTSTVLCECRLPVDHDKMVPNIANVPRV
jgi:hypothetical protein